MIDVIVPTYNRVESLRRTIDSYLAQPELGRLIIVDDCSTDATGKWAEDLMREHPGRVVYHLMERKTTLPYLRNVGISLAKGDFIFMGEDDVLLPDGHFRILLEKMAEHGADIVSGRRIYLRDGQTEDDAKRIADLDTGPVFTTMPFEGYFERVVPEAGRVPFTHSNALMRRSLLDRVRYDPWYGGNAFREELDFYLRAHAAGFVIGLVPDTWSFHLKGTAVNVRGGSRRRRLVYEFQVWRNTFRCFWKNRRIFRKEFGVRHILLYALRCLLARYGYAAKRRIGWLRTEP